MVNIISAYVPQTGCLEEDKQQLLEELEALLRGIPREEVLLVVAALCGHVGSNRRWFEKQQSPFGLELKNGRVSRILETSEAFRLVDCLSTIAEEVKAR